jgi:hypothetical protein
LFIFSNLLDLDLDDFEMYEPLDDGRQYRKQVHKYKKTDSTTIQMHSSGVIHRRRKSDRWFKKHKTYVFAFAVLCFFFLLYQIVTYIRFAWDASDDAKSAYYERKESKYSKDEMEYFKSTFYRSPF